MSNFVRALALAIFAALAGCGGATEPVHHRAYRAPTTGVAETGNGPAVSSSSTGGGYVGTSATGSAAATNGSSNGPVAGSTGSASSGAAGASASTGTGATSTSGAGTTSGTSGVSGSSGGAGFQPGAHEPFPMVPNNGLSPVLDRVQLVTITFDGYSYRPDVEDYLSWLAGSSWIREVGADYGVGAGEAYATVHLLQAAPQQIDDTEIQTELEQLITAGTVPAPGGALTQPLYVIFYPQSTQVTAGWGSMVSCRDFGGYHSDRRAQNLAFSYAVVPTCDMGAKAATLQALWSVISHEVIEAATDPFPMEAPTWEIVDPNSPWSYLPGEVGDLCVGLDAQVDGHWAQRIWSNTAAAAGGAPCIPVPSGAYVNTSVAQAMLDLAPGESATIDVRGWSSAPTSPWTVELYTSTGTFMPEASWSSARLQNGQSIPLTLTVPLNASSGSYSVLLLASQGFNIWPLVVNVR